MTNEITAAWNTSTALTVQVPASLVCSDSGTAARKPLFPGLYGRRCPGQGRRTVAPWLCLSSDTVRPDLYTSDLPVTYSCRFIEADDISCALQPETFSEIQCTLTAYLVCQLWHLKPSTSKTVISVFHLHDNRSRCELNVQMNGQR